MDIIRKWNQIINWQEENLKLKDKNLYRPILKEDIAVIERLLGETLPEVFNVFYLHGNGQVDHENPIFFGEKFMSSQEIITHLDYAKSLIKPEIQLVPEPEKAQKILQKIIEFYTSNAPKHRLFGLQKSWYKIEFSFGLDSFGGPYLYQGENTISREREILKISNYEPVKNIVRELYELEYESYKWDEIEVVVYADGQFEAKRINYNFDDEISFTSTPENAIKKKYLNHKWVPIFSDYGGNFIGIDLDPDVNGKKGQIINFGRDEEDMIVMAENLENFFDLILLEISKNNGESLRTEYHFHDVIKKVQRTCK